MALRSRSVHPSNCPEHNQSININACKSSASQLKPKHFILGNLHLVCSVVCPLLLHVITCDLYVQRSPHHHQGSVILIKHHVHRLGHQHVPQSLQVLGCSQYISFLWLKIFAAHLLEGGGRPDGAALVPEEDAAAGHQHGAAHQAEQPGPLELGGEAGLVVVLTEPVIIMSVS